MRDRSIFSSRIVLFSILFFPLFQVTSFWFYTGPEVDEAELVMFAVGFLGGNLDPNWDGYGHLGMYLLGLAYYLDGQLSILFNNSESLVQYTSESLDTGRFYVLGRLLFASLLNVSAFVAAMLFFSQGKQVSLAIVFFALLALAPTTSFYANYIRSDTLVAFFTIAALSLSMADRAEDKIYWVSFSLAAAVACKISALPVLAYLPFMLCGLYLKGKISIAKSCLALFSMLALVFLLSPFMNYLGLIEQIVIKEIAGAADNFSRTEYVSFLDRFNRIVEIHLHALGMAVCVLASLSVVAMFTVYRKLVISIAVMLFFLIFPYFFGHTLREYWFIPSFFLVSLLAFVTVGATFILLKRSTGSSFPSFALAALVTTLVCVQIYSFAGRHYHGVSQAMNQERVETNREVAEKWLAQEHLGITPILIDRHYLWLYPKLYDSNYLKISRAASEVFTYQRATNEFLSKAFEYKLYKETGVSSPTVVGSDEQLHRLRLDFEGSVSAFDNPQICSYYSHWCEKLEFELSNDLNEVDSASQTYERAVVQTGDDPYVIYKVGKRFSSDGGHYVKVSSNADSLQLFFDIGAGFDKDNQVRFAGSSGKARLQHIRRAAWVNLLGAGELPRLKLGVTHRALFVTSPAAYGRFEVIAKSANDEKKSIIAQGMVQRYKEMTRLGPLKVFDKAAGVAIEVYEIPDSLRNN